MIEQTDIPSRSDRRRSLAWAARAARARLRFLAALAVASLVVGRWDVLRTYWDRWTAPAARDPAMGAVSADTEYFCPMDPGVLSGWPGKCPICQMATVRRPRGDMGPLPDGVVARVQLSPGRLLLGGIRSEPARYRPLAAEVHSVGPATPEGGLVLIRAEVGAGEVRFLGPGQPAEVALDPPDGTPSAPGRVRRVESPSEGAPIVVVEVEAPPPSLRLARFASIAIRPPMADREPFRSMPRGEPPTGPGEPRAAFECPDHPGVVRDAPGRCPVDDLALGRAELARHQRLAWWCPRHPKVVADRAGAPCGECGGVPLVARVVSYSPIGEVLAVPESAVVDTGSRALVYVESMPGVFDGVEVRLGPRCGAFYPVVEGLEAGQLVASTGAFLVDAETRLNPSLAAGYFGARREEVAAPKPPAKPKALDLAGLDPADRAAAKAQATCPVTGKPLGSMGPPPRVVVRGRPVFLCCEGCDGPIRRDPDKFLAKLKAADAPAHHP